MPLTSRLIGLHLAVFGFVWMLWIGTGGNIGMFIDLPSLLGVLVLLVGCSLFCFTLGEIGDAAGAVFAGPGDASEAQLRRRVAIAAQAYQLAWGAGIVINLTGLIAMLADLSDPSAIGAGMAVALISTLYGAFLAEFIFAPCRRTLQNHLENHLAGENHGPDIVPPASNGSGLWRGATVVLLILSCAFISIVRYGEVKFDNYLSSQGVDEYRAYYSESNEAVDTDRSSID